MCKRKTQLMQHRQSIHDIEVIWYQCGVEGCAFETKRKCNLKPHRKAIHGIEVEGEAERAELER